MANLPPIHDFRPFSGTAVKVAAAGAKLEVLRIINEPTAAALAYGHGGHGPSTARERLGDNIFVLCWSENLVRFCKVKFYFDCG